MRLSARTDVHRSCGYWPLPLLAARNEAAQSRPRAVKPQERRPFVRALRLLENFNVQERKGLLASASRTRGQNRLGGHLQDPRIERTGGEIVQPILPSLHKALFVSSIAWNNQRPFLGDWNT